jgi:hypothetical protein
MKKAFPFFTAAVMLVTPLALLPLGVLAQSQAAQSATANAAQVQVRCEPRDPKDTRPNDLRAALQQQRQRCDDTPDTNASGRHLSPQEKAQLREQLRQQR